MIPEKLNNKIQEGYRQLFNTSTYDIFVSIGFGSMKFGRNSPYRLTNELVRNIAKSRKTQVAGFGVFNNLKSAHAHLLLFGKSCSLKEINSEELGRYWEYGSTHVENVLNEGAAGYLASNITPNAPEKSEVLFFNIRLLRKATYLTFDKIV